MSVTIPSLWPEDIKVDVLPPLTILKLQAAKLHEITKGILHAEVTTVTGPDDLTAHRLDLIAPTLDDRRVRILTATQRTEFYPVVVEAELYRPPKVSVQDVKKQAMQGVAAMLGVDTRTEYPLRIWPPVDDWRPVANDQSDFLKRVGEVLRSPAVRATIDSLIALSNEKNQPLDSEPAA